MGGEGHRRKGRARCCPPPACPSHPQEPHCFTQQCNATGCDLEYQKTYFEKLGLAQVGWRAALGAAVFRSLRCSLPPISRLGGLEGS